jgi:hypothetical protein
MSLMPNTLALGVEKLSPWDKENLPPGFSHPAGPIRFFEIEEETFVEKTHGVQGGLSNHHAGANAGFHLNG